MNEVEPQELLDTLDALTLKMIEAVRTEKFEELETLYKRRRALMEKLPEFNGQFSEAALSKLAHDSKQLRESMKMSMKRIKEKVEEISQNLEFLKKYGMKDENSQIDERR